MDRISEQDIDRLKPRRREDGTLADAFIWDGEQTGFGVKVTPAGKKVFIVQYRIGGRAGTTQRVTIGAYGAVTLTKARRQAEDMLAKVQLAKNDPSKQAPAEVARAVKRAAQQVYAAGTLKEAIERFLVVEGQPTQYWLWKRQRMLGTDLKGLHGKSIKKITASELIEMFDTVRQKNASRHSLLFRDLRPFFRWAKKRVPLERNPMEDVDAPKPAKPRDRKLDPHEIRAFWHACDYLRWPFASMFRLLLLTGARLEEVAAIQWRELDDAGLWVLPAKEEFTFERPRRDGTVLVQGRTKNTRAHTVPLVQTAVRLLDQVEVNQIKAEKKYPLESDFVFSTTGRTPPSGESKAKKALDTAMQKELGKRFKPWRLHDLRRTCASGMEDAGIATNVVETALNHVSGTKAGIVGVYQRAEHKEAVRAAFERWSERVMEIVGSGDLPTNVVPLRKLG